MPASLRRLLVLVVLLVVLLGVWSPRAHAQEDPPAIPDGSFVQDGWYGTVVTPPSGMPATVEWDPLVVAADGEPVSAAVLVTMRCDSTIDRPRWASYTTPDGRPASSYPVNGHEPRIYLVLPPPDSGLSAWFTPCTGGDQGTQPHEVLPARVELQAGEPAVPTTPVTLAGPAPENVTTFPTSDEDPESASPSPSMQVSVPTWVTPVLLIVAWLYGAEWAAGTLPGPPIRRLLPGKRGKQRPHRAHESERGLTRRLRSGLGVGILLAGVVLLPASIASSTMAPAARSGLAALPVAWATWRVAYWWRRDGVDSLEAAARIAWALRHQRPRLLRPDTHAPIAGGAALLGWWHGLAWAHIPLLGLVAAHLLAARPIVKRFNAARGPFRSWLLSQVPVSEDRLLVYIRDVDELGSVTSAVAVMPAGTTLSSPATFSDSLGRSAGEAWGGDWAVDIQFDDYGTRITLDRGQSAELTGPELRLREINELVSRLLRADEDCPMDVSVTFDETGTSVTEILVSPLPPSMSAYDLPLVEDQLTEALGDERGPWVIDATFLVGKRRARMAPQPLPVLPDDVPVTGTDRFADLPERSLYLGETFHGQRVVWNLLASPHGLVCGASGSGKSTLLALIVFQALQKGWRVGVIDPNKGAEGLGLFRPFCRWWGVDGTPDDDHLDEDSIVDLGGYEAALEAVRDSYRQVQRFKAVKADDPRVEKVSDLTPEVRASHDLGLTLLILDEAFSLLGKTASKGRLKEIKAELLELISALIREGRSAGVHLVLAAQRPDKAVLSGEMVSNIDARVVVGIAENVTDRQVLFSNPAAAPSVTTKTFRPGRGVFELPGLGCDLFQAGWLPDKERTIAQHLRRSSGRRSSTSPNGAFDDPQSEADDPFADLDDLLGSEP